MKTNIELVADHHELGVLLGSAVAAGNWDNAERHRSGMRAIGDEIRARLAERDEARATIVELTRELDEARAEIERLRRAVDSAHNMIDARNREIEDLRNDLERVALKERLLRYTGRTTAQMRSAPRDGEVVYVWPFPTSLDYPRRRVWELGRIDIKVVTPVWVRSGNYRGRSCHVIVDHSTPIDTFDINQWHELVEHADRMNTTPTHAG